MRKRYKNLSAILVCLMLLTCMPADAFASDMTPNSAFGAITGDYEQFPGEGFEAEFRVTSQWTGAFNGEIILKNTGEEPLENWALGFQFGHRITSSWSADIIKNEDGVYILKNKGWNGTIPVGGTVNLGFAAEWNETINAPADYRICTQEQEADPQDYTVEFKTTSDWGSGFNGEISITNNSDKPIEYWKLSFDFENNIQNFWSARIINREGNHYAIKHAGYNAVIQPGASLKLGFGGSPGNVNNSPENCKLTKIEVLPYDQEEEENNEPIITSTPETDVTEGEEYKYQVEAEDEDGDFLIYSLEEKPEGMEIDADSGFISWLPEIGQVGGYNVTIKVTDNQGGEAIQEFVLTVYEALALTAEITATPQSIRLGESALLSWETANAHTVIIDQGIGAVDASGSINITPSETTQYTITAIGQKETVTAAVTVHVSISDLPVVAFSDDFLTIQKGGSATLAWTAEGAQTAHLDNGIGKVEPNGTITVSPSHTTTYTITVTGMTGSASAQATVKVLGDPALQSVGTFGNVYNDLIPADSTVESYSEDRFSLITGLVHDNSGMPLEAVAVTVFDHPEYGTSYTDQEGRYTIPVEGGGNLTVVYHKKNYLSPQRQLQVPWNQTAIADTVVLLTEDPMSTTLIFDGDPQTITNHRSTPVTDEYGTRSISMVFNGDNKAWLVDEDGNDIYQLESITVRATEFTTQDSMPAVLPPNTAYTYCAELAVDGAERVRFEKPVVTWVDNFLNFPVGEAVPSGYFDRDRNLWIPSQNGIVVMLLDINGDGIVDALDTTGDGDPDVTDPEQLQGLEDSSIYMPGATFWRVEVSHFTPWDYNWPYGPPMDAISPNAKGAPQMQQDRSFHEEIAIPGTDLSLDYVSDRTKGYKTVITVPASGATVPDSLDSIIVELCIAGRVFQKILPPIPDQTAEFEWDGLDHLGREINWATPAEARIGFVYPSVYYRTRADWLSSFAINGISPTGTGARQPFIKWSKTQLDAYTNETADTIGEGWTISAHHQLRLNAVPVLLRGDGSTVPFADVNFSETFARFFVEGYEPDKILGAPLCVETDASGNIYASTYYNIYKIDKYGNAAIVAGNGEEGYSGDGGPAVNASLYYPHGITVDTSGNLYIADTVNDRIRKVDSSGIITTVAGNGESGYSGDGGPAVDASLCRPVNIALDSSGNLYIADTENHRIRKVDPSGIITTVAGNGDGGYSGDGSPAVNTSLYYPVSIVLDSSGDLYIADSGNYRIRKVDPSGMITTAAGSGEEGYSGDGGPAVEAALSYAEDIAVDGMGRLYIADADNDVIRTVFPDGTIITVAGTKNSVFSADDNEQDVLPALLDPLERPRSIAFDGTGNLYIVDAYHDRISKISASPLLVESFEDEAYTFVEDDIYYTFNAVGRHLRTVDLATGMTLFEFLYDQNGNLTAIRDRFDRELVIERDDSSEAQAIISPDGIRTILTIGGNKLTSITYPNGANYDLAYTEDGLLTGVTDLNGNIYQRNYDSKGRLTSTTDSEGGEWQYDRVILPGGKAVTEVISAEGLVTLFEESEDASGASNLTVKEPSGAETVQNQAAGNLDIQEQLPDGSTIHYNYNLDPKYYNKYTGTVIVDTPLNPGISVQTKKTYDDTDGDGMADLITVVTAANEKETVTTHNILTSTIAVTSPEGRTVTARYNPETLLIEQEDVPGQLSTYYEYDTDGRLRYQRTGTRETEYQYNTSGFLFTVITPDQKTVSYEYDEIGRVTIVHCPDGSTVHYEYDNNGNVTAMTAPFDANHEYQYNKIDAATQYLTPQSGYYSYTYNKDQQLTRTISPAYRQTQYVYDGGQLAEIITPTGDSVSLEYLNGILLNRITKDNESIAYEYAGSLIIKKTLNGVLNGTMEYSYDDDLRLESFTYAGKTQVYAYDKDGLLTKAGGYNITRDQQNGLPTAIAGGPLSIISSFSGYGETESRTYKASSETTFEWSAVRDDMGRITQKTEILEGSTITYNYTYDDFGRLLTVSRNGVLTEDYQYDEAGRRTSSTSLLRDVDGRSHTYSIEDHLLTAGDIRYEYDPDGFLDRKIEGTQITDYSYSSLGELLQMTQPDGTEIEYQYDALGKRIAKKINSAVVEKYLWEGLNLLAVYDGSDNLLMRFEYAGMPQPVSMEMNGDFYYLSYDQTGSLRTVTDSSGNVVKTIDYDSFGNIINDTNPTLSLPLGFAGGLQDRDIGLVFFGARDYDPDAGRWTAKDPTFFGGGDTNLYSYCFNDPVNYADQSGAIPVETAVDVLSIGWSLSALISNPSLANAGYLAWDVIAALVPYAPGSYIVKGGQILSKLDNGVSIAKGAGKTVFKTQDLFDSHYAKHAKEFGNITKGQYLKGAQNLVNSKPGGNVLTKTRSNGDVLFYNKAHNEFAVKASDGTIRTYFKPTDGIDYFNRQR